MRKVAIMGKCSNSRSDAPMDLRGWEIWGLAWDPLPRCDRMFEMHEEWRNFLGNPADAAAHHAWLSDQLCPIYMLKKEHDIPTSVEYPMEMIADDADTPEQTVLNADRRSQLRICIEQISSDHREVIDLVYYHEKSVEEVAKILNLPKNTVKTRMFYARKRLSELLKAEGIERGWP